MAQNPPRVFFRGAVSFDPITGKEVVAYPDETGIAISYNGQIVSGNNVDTTGPLLLSSVRIAEQSPTNAAPTNVAPKPTSPPKQQAAFNPAVFIKQMSNDPRSVDTSCEICGKSIFARGTPPKPCHTCHRVNYCVACSHGEFSNGIYRGYCSKC